METKKKVLGRGLEQLFNSEKLDVESIEKQIYETSSNEEIIEVNKICDDEYKIVFDASQYDFSQKKLIPIKIKIYFSEVYLENASGKIIRN